MGLVHALVIFTALVVFSATGIHFFTTGEGYDRSHHRAGDHDRYGFPFVFMPVASGAGRAGQEHQFRQGTGALYAGRGVHHARALRHFYMFKAGAPMSLATPIARFLPAVLAVILGVFYFHETLKMTQILGLVLSFVAVFLVVNK